LAIIVEDVKGDNKRGELEEGIGVIGNRRIRNKRRRCNRRTDITEER
jgi:hypothetical protein